MSMLHAQYWLLKKDMQAKNKKLDYEYFSFLKISFDIYGCYKHNAFYLYADYY